MSHRQRQRSTHLLTASRRVQNGTDAESEPIYDRSDVVSDEPVRFQPGGTSFVREDGGERVRRMPTARGRARLVESLQEGDRVTLVPFDADLDDTDSDEFEIVAVNGKYGRRGRPAAAEIELEAK